MKHNYSFSLEYCFCTSQTSLVYILHGSFSNIYDTILSESQQNLFVCLLIRLTYNFFCGFGGFLL